MASPFDWTPEIMQEICDCISSGMSLREVCRCDGMPSEPTVYRKLANDDEFASMMTVARAAQQDCEMDRCIEMADDATVEDWQVVKLRIWARQWRASKLAPKKYGESKHLDIDAKVNASINLVNEFPEE